MSEQTGMAHTQFSRRRDPRINITLPVEYTMSMDLAPSLPSKTGTLGGGGLMLYLPMAVPVDRLMKLKISLPGRPAIPCTVRVVWTELLTGLERSDFMTGVAFDQIADGDLDRLRSFIKGQQNPSELPTALYRHTLE